MKFLLVTLALSAHPLVVAPLQEEEAEVPAIAREDRQAEFRTAFFQAHKINAKEEMGKLIKRYVNEAVFETIDLCLAIEREELPEYTDNIYALDEGWRAAFPDSSFVMTVYEYFSLQTQLQKRERRRLQRIYDRVNNDLLGSLEEGDGPTFEGLAVEFEGLAEGFERFGDLYHVSQCWNNHAICYDDRYRKQGEDLDRAWESYDSMRRFRDMIGCRDDYYAFAETRQKEIENLGYGPGSGSLGAAGGAAAGVGNGGAAEGAEAGTPAAAAMSATLSFELIEEVDDIERPNYSMDEFYQIWPSIYFETNGTQSVIHSMEGSPTFTRVGAAKVGIDSDGDGEVDVDVPIRGNPVLTEFVLQKDAFPRKWAFVSTIGTDQDFYQGIQVNLQPDDNNFSLYLINAGSMVGDVQGTSVRLIDDNMDGVYGDYPLSWGYVGLNKGLNQPEMDSVVVGGGKRAVPWSQFQKFGDAWYEWEATEGGTKLTLRPAVMKTGRLALEFKGPKPSWLIMRGTDRVEWCFFDLAKAGKKGVEVPVGKYTVYYGELRKGKRRQMMKTLILPGGDKSWTVKPDETTTIALGQPFGFDFEWELSGDGLTVIGGSIGVVGASGERYERPWNCLPRPEVAWRKAGSKKASKPKKMKVILSQDELNVLGWDKIWHPLDLTIGIKNPPEEGIEVQLTEKKNKLFGKIESAWKD